MLRGPLHNAGADGNCTECGEPFPCPDSVAIFESVIPRRTIANPRCTPERAERLRALLHQSPRTFGQPTSVWTLDRAAQVSFAQGLLPERVSGETIRLALKRLGVGWKRAKRWITSPDPVEWAILLAKWPSPAGRGVSGQAAEWSGMGSSAGLSGEV